MRNLTVKHPFRRLGALMLAVTVGALLPLCAAAESTSRTVRIGWYESPFNMTDEYGRRSGYAYEYQLKVAAYTGWTYEYVEGSWPELLEQLKNGEIDMMSDVSYTEERIESMYFPSLPMGTESYYVFISPQNEDISADDYTSLNGKKLASTRAASRRTCSSSGRSPTASRRSLWS